MSISCLARWFSVSLILAPVVAVCPMAAGIGADDSAKTAKGESPAVKAAAALYEGIRTETLPNGLRVYLKPVPESPVVAIMVAYKVGSADEDLDSTGLSHYLEHLMFKGTDKIKPGDIDRLTLQNGGLNNAYTSENYTVYHFDFASDRWEAALDIEADRMRNLRIDTAHEFEQEKGAVISELMRNEDRPWDLEQKAILPLLFGKTGPYGHPVIGESKHVRAATAKIIKGHYDKWYHPNNASLVICGGFDPDKALAKIKDLFGPIPRHRLPARKVLPEIKPERPMAKEITSKFEVARMVMGFNTVRSGEPDYYALEVLQGILSGGKTSRLYTKLVEGEEIATQAEASNEAGRYPGWFGLQVELLQGKDRAKAEKLVLAELKRLRDEPAKPQELKRVQQMILADTIFRRESVHGLADSIARGVTTNDLDFLKTYLARIAAVTAHDVQNAARKYLDPEQRVVVWSVPGKAAGEKGGKKDKEKQGGKDKETRRKGETGNKGEGGGSFSLKDAQRVVLDNGLTLLLYENHRLPIVAAQASVGQVRLMESEDKSGLATLMGGLLDEGTARRPGPEIAELIENVGGALSFSASGGTVKVLAPDRHLGLSLFFECLTQPSFPKEAFARVRDQQLSGIADSERQPNVRAQRIFNRMAYGKHPLGRSPLGERKTVQALSPEDCKAFHARLFLPNNTLVAIVGDFDSKQIIEEVKSLTADWKRGPPPKIALPEIKKPKDFVQKIVPMKEAAQLHFYMGHAGIRRKNPDYFKLLVMDYVLGTGPGFTDRLSARLRDREGLAYTVAANITSSAGLEPGLFTCYIGTEPKNFAKVKGMFLEELARIRDEKPKPEEVEDAKKYLLGSLPFEFTTNEQVAGQLLVMERYQLGFGYLDDFRKAVAAVTPEDVQQVARQYIDPAHMILVACGAIDEKGKVLPNQPSTGNE